MEDGLAYADSELEAGVDLKEAFKQAQGEPMLRGPAEGGCEGASVAVFPHSGGAARFLVMMQTAEESLEASVDLSWCELGAPDVEALRGHAQGSANCKHLQANAQSTDVLTGALMCRGRLTIDLESNLIGGWPEECLLGEPAWGFLSKAFLRSVLVC